MPRSTGTERSYPRAAILSFLFNWPSTGGGNVHTYELAHFLGKTGYDVCHFYIVFDLWRIGQISEALPYASCPLVFDEKAWTLPGIQEAVRRAIAEYGPDLVIITDSWNMKPRLAEAVSPLPYILRFQAMECLCPLNNYRLLPEPQGKVRQCPRHQLATPDICRKCIASRQQHSGWLHQSERDLSGYGTEEYDASLRRSLAAARSVFVVNPLHEAMLSPYAGDVRVVTAGMDTSRFLHVHLPPSGPKTVFLFSGLLEEWVKGFHILVAAAEHLWSIRKDFEIIATGDRPAAGSPPYIKYIGWQSQERLPGHLVAADVVVVPTVGQDALGRTAVEAMAAARPVIASRIGGLPFTVTEDATGLFFEPGDALDLARIMAKLMDNPSLRRRLGEGGRRRFESNFTWEVIIERHYRPLLDSPRVKPTLGADASVPPPRRIGRDQLLQEAASCFRLPLTEVRQVWDHFQRLFQSAGYERTFGSTATLFQEEVFLLYLAQRVFRPEVVVDIGTRDGQVARHLLDMRAELGMVGPITCVDLEDRVRFVAPGEVKLVIGDVSGRFERAILQSYEPDLLFLNHRGDAQLREVVAETLRGCPHCKVVLIGVLRGLSNSRRSETSGRSTTSPTAEENVDLLAEFFDMSFSGTTGSGPFESAQHHLWRFQTHNDLCLILPR